MNWFMKWFNGGLEPRKRISLDDFPPRFIVTDVGELQDSVTRRVVFERATGGRYPERLDMLTKDGGLKPTPIVGSTAFRIMALYKGEVTEWLIDFGGRLISYTERD